MPRVEVKRVPWDLTETSYERPPGMVVVAAFAPSTQGDAALKTALWEVSAAADELVIASHAYPDSTGDFDCAERDEVHHALARVASQLPEAQRAYLETLDVPVMTSQSRDIGEFILDVADRTHASLIVLALRHAAPIGRLSLGQSVRRVLLGAECPVLVAKDAATQS